MEFLIGGIAGAGGTLISNPLDVVKVRLQLQGELQKYNRHRNLYRGMIHALFAIATKEGPMALQKGLVPALALGFTMNAIRLGIFQVATKNGWTHTTSGEVTMLRAAAVAALAGICGCVFANPAYLVKTRMQACSHPSIAVGRQYRYNGTMHAIGTIYRREGLAGFWAGATAASARLAVGSAAQLTTFTKSKELLNRYEFFAHSQILLAFLASCASGVTVAVLTCPLDVCTVRLYNQGGRRDLYGGFLNCITKIYLVEGLHGLYKGLGPLYLRIAPHNMVSLLIWDALNRMEKRKNSER